MSSTRKVGEAERATELAELNRALSQDNDRFALAAEVAGLGLWSFDLVGNALLWDERMVLLHGRSLLAGEGLFSAWTGNMHPADLEKFERESADALKGARPFDLEFRVIHPIHGIRHLKSAARIRHDRDGRPSLICGVSFDITDLRRAEEKFHLAIEAAPTGMLLMDMDGRVVMVNAQIENLFGYARAELLGRHVEMLVPERLRVHQPEHRKEFFKAPNAQTMGAGSDLYGLRKDGTEVPVEIGLNPLHTSEGELVLSSIVDLSQRREIDRLRNDFVSTVSHELRTPLTSINGSLGLLQSGAMGALSDKAAAMVGIAYKNSERLVRIINDILDIGKLEAGQLALHPVSVPLSELLRQSVEINAAYAEKYQVRFLIDGGSADDRVLADPDRLMQVITNLLSNAAKFSPPGADVYIRILPGLSTVRVEVEDSGAGIPEAFRRQIFEKFAQADASPTRRFEGTGLGLSIARRLVEAMGGTIGFSTVVGQGTIFYIELPRTDAQSVVLRQRSLSETATHRALLATADLSQAKAVLPRVLFVEDDEDLISVIGATLTDRVQIIPAHNLQRAERLLREERFDLVILDQMLPDGNGLMLVDRIPELVVPKVILLVTDPPRVVDARVAAVLVKSQVSAAQAAATILSYLSSSHP